MKVTFKRPEDFGKYIVKNCEEISRNLDPTGKAFRGYCKTCKENARFEIQRLYKLEYNDSALDYVPATVSVRCPTCHEYIILLIFVNKKYSTSSPEVYLYKTFPPQEQSDELPSTVPSTYTGLANSYKEAVKCCNAGAYMAASAMFRRCLQIFLREVLNVRHPSNKLDEEIKLAEKNKLIGSASALNAELLQKIGNQGAHPPKGIAPSTDTSTEEGNLYELENIADFTEEDAVELHRYLLEIVDETFSIPEALKQAREDVIKRRDLRLKRQETEDRKIKTEKTEST